MQTLMNEHEVSRLLCLKVATLRRWRWAGTGPKFIKLGASVRYDPRDLEQYINERRTNSTTMDLDYRNQTRASKE